MLKTIHLIESSEIDGKYFLNDHLTNNGNFTEYGFGISSKVDKRQHYVAPVIDIFYVELESGIAAASAVIEVNTSTISRDQWNDGGTTNSNEGDITFP